MRFPEKREIARSGDSGRPLLYGQKGRYPIRSDADERLRFCEVVARGNGLVRARLMVLARRGVLAVLVRMVVPVVVVVTMRGVLFRALPMGKRTVAEIARENVNRPRLVLAELHDLPRRKDEEKGE